MFFYLYPIPSIRFVFSLWVFFLMVTPISTVYAYQKNMLHLQYQSFDPLLNQPDSTLFSSISVKQASEENYRYFIIQFKGPILQKDRNMLHEAGVTVFDYIPNNAFIVRMTQDIVSDMKNKERVRWIGPYAPQYKISSDVIEKVSTLSPQLSSQQSLDLRITIFSGEPLDDIIQRLSVVGTVKNQYTTKWRSSIQLTIHPIHIPDLTQIEGIQWISFLPKWQLLNNVASQIVNVRQPRERFDLYGEGQTVAVCDTGLDQGKTTPESLHDDFEDGKGHSRVKKIFNLTPGIFNDEPDDIFSGHGTHVAGTILGNGFHSGSQPQINVYPSNSYAGMAPKASLVFQAAEDSSTGMLLGLMLDLNQIFAQAYFSEARIHSNSWGAASGSTYSSECEDVDQFMWDHKDFLIVFAAGNSGIDMDHDGRIDPYSICSPGSSKNCLTVGGSETVRSNGGYTCSWGGCWPDLYPKDPIASDHISDNSDGMAAFSSRGPTLDGRYKPDIVAPATNILSVRSSKASYQGWGTSSNRYYMYMGGTSMATPIVSGSAALIREYLNKIGFSTPSSALIKATLMNAAESMGYGQYGDQDTQEIPLLNPNYVNGWGLLNLGNGVYPEYPLSIIYKDNDALETNGTIIYEVVVIDEHIPLKVNLVWTDYPGSPVSQGGLVNDLDFHIISPTNQIHYPDGAINQSNISTLQYDMNFPLLQTDTNECGMKFTPENDSCILDAISVSVANPNDVQDDIWIRVYEFQSMQLRYEKQYHYLPSGWTTLPIDHIELREKEFIVAIEKTSPEIQVTTDIFSNSGRGLIKQNGEWVSTYESFYIRSHVRQRNEATDYDRANNSLGIYLNHPERGKYQIHVTGHNVPKGPQPFALVARGAIKESSDLDQLNLTIPEVFNESDGIIKDAGMVSIPAPLGNTLTVYLTSSDASEITLQQKIILPTGQTQVRFDIQVIDDSLEDGTQSVIIEAKADFFISASMTVTVEDNDVSPVLEVSPKSYFAPYTKGIAVFTVTNAGYGQMKWYANVDRSWLSIIDGESGINGGNISILHQKNSGENRVGHLIVNVPAADGLTQIITIQQKSEQIETIISPEDGYQYDYFGIATSIWNNQALIGAYRHDVNQTNDGAAYIYEFDGNAWQPVQKIYAQNSHHQDHFGSSVSIYDTQIAIGAYRNDDLGNCSGAAYIFEKIDNQWVETATILPSDGMKYDYFGYSVDIDNNQMIAGAYKSDTKARDAGAAYVFEKKDGIWSEKCRIVPQNLKPYDHFGFSTAIHDQYIVVGAYGDDSRGSLSGAAYIFEKINDVWIEKATLIPQDIKPYDFLGYSVDISSQYAVIGAYKSDTVGLNAGAAYVFEKKDGDWVQTAELYPWKSTDGYDFFGASVSISDDYIVIGAYGDSTKGHSAGAAYVFRQIDGTWEEIVHLVASNGQSNDYLGSSVSISTNGDVLVGANGHNSKGIQSGIAYLYSVFSTQTAPSLTIQNLSKSSLPMLSNLSGVSVETKNQKTLSNNIVLPKQIQQNQSQFKVINLKKTVSTDIQSIVYTQIPEKGNRIKNLKGKINFSPDAEQLSLTVYTYSQGLWHLKATSLPVMDNGSFEVDITTVPGDHLANAIVIFVLPEHQLFDWPKRISSIPDSFYKLSLIWDIIKRN